MRFCHQVPSTTRLGGMAGCISVGGGASLGAPPTKIRGSVIKSHPQLDWVAQQGALSVGGGASLGTPPPTNRIRFDHQVPPTTGFQAGLGGLAGCISKLNIRGGASLGAPPNTATLGLPGGHSAVGGASSTFLQANTLYIDKSIYTLLETILL